MRILQLTPLAKARVWFGEKITSRFEAEGVITRSAEQSFLVGQAAAWLSGRRRCFRVETVRPGLASRKNRLLRGEAPEVREVFERTRIFDVTGGLRMSVIVCSWDASTADVVCQPVHEGTAEQFELVVKEEAGAELVMSLAERIALNGVTVARKSSDLR